MSNSGQEARRHLGALERILSDGGDGGEQDRNRERAGAFDFARFWFSPMTRSTLLPRSFEYPTANVTREKI